MTMRPVSPAPWRVALLAAAVVLGGAWQTAPAPTKAAVDLPKKLSDAEFWQMVVAFSEAGGHFPSNNFVSNEIVFQTVVPRLRTALGTGGVYLGVGPDQNFTYITALEPKIAFIIDIRRQNLLHHLLYKSIIERSPTRAEFLSRLFSRPKPRDLPDSAPPDTLISAFAAVAPSAELFATNLNELRDHLVDKHKFALSPQDLATIKFVYQAFFDGGPDLTYGGPRTLIFADRQMQVNIYPTYGDLVSATDSEGVQRGYLSTADRYKTLREMQLKNLIVPIVGDFAGPSALRAIGAYLKERKATVSAIYTSNVEQYLFQNGVWRTYYDNVAELPLDAKSTFIRAIFNSSGIRFIVDPWTPPQSLNPIKSVSLLCSVLELIEGVRAGTVRNYADVASLSVK